MNARRSDIRYLRPIEAVPVGLSDAAVMERLKAAGSGVRGPSVEAARTASLVAFVLGIAAREQLSLHSGLAPWQQDVLLPPEQIAVRTGVSLPAIQSAIRLLASARILDEIRGAYRFSEEVFAPLGEDGALHWPAILAALHGDGTGILVCRAHVSLANVSPDTWSAVATRDVSDQTGYGADTIRRARRRALEAGILEERRLDGASTQFRFTGLAFGLAPAEPGAAPTPPAAAVQHTPPAPMKASTGGAPSLPPAAAGAAGFRLVLAGSSLEVPGGVHVSVEVDDAGRPVIRLELP